MSGFAGCGRGPRELPPRPFLLNGPLKNPSIRDNQSSRNNITPFIISFSRPSLRSNGTFPDRPITAPRL